MWPKLLLELLPHLAPAAGKLLSRAGGIAPQSDADTQRLAEALRRDVAQANESVARALQDNADAIHAVKGDIKSINAVAQAALSNSEALQAQVDKLAFWLRLTAAFSLLAILGTSIALFVTLRHHG